jgi:peptide subunit release factor 1 (eRF1)
MKLSANQYNLNKNRLLHLLDELKASSIETASLCIPPRVPRIEIEGLLETILDLKDLPENLSGAMAESSTGAVLFWGTNHRYLVLPPFPLNEERTSPACEIEPLRTLLHQEYLFGLVLVRLGAYAIGVVQGEKILSSKVGTGLVHARHRQGGSSSHRFERHREKQMETFFTRVCGHAREQLEPCARDLQYLVYGGTRETLLEFRKQCHFIQQFEARALDHLLNIREPNRSGLDDAVQEAWSSRVVRWNE